MHDFTARSAICKTHAPLRLQVLDYLCQGIIAGRLHQARGSSNGSRLRCWACIRESSFRRWTAGLATSHDCLCEN
jgi:hypothetical protein